MSIRATEAALATVVLERLRFEDNLAIGGTGPETGGYGEGGGMSISYAVATGSELGLALAAQQILAAEGVPARVVSMPSWEIFADQDDAYRDRVLPPSIRARVSIEAGVAQGWERWVGDAGKTVSIDRFGASAPGDELMERFGFTAEAAAKAARSIMR